jgi:hypothetical protein
MPETIYMPLVDEGSRRLKCVCCGMIGKANIHCGRH